mgnify:CR=1 FL=1
MKFPFKKYYKISSFTNHYFKELQRCIESLNYSDLKKIINVLDKLYKNKNGTLYVCGNGGSAAISNHFACDHQKILSQIKPLRPMITSLSSNSAIMTAISNDINYSEVFVEQLKAVANKNDVLLVISSSGSSKNIIKALDWANKFKIKTISFTGFDGGYAKKKAKFNIHCDSYNYGIIESMHHNIMNIISQYIRNKYSSSKKISTEMF